MPADGGLPARAERLVSTFKMDSVAKLDQPFVPFSPGTSAFSVASVGAAPRILREIALRNAD